MHDRHKKSKSRLENVAEEMLETVLSHFEGRDWICTYGCVNVTLSKLVINNMKRSKERKVEFAFDDMFSSTDNLISLKIRKELSETITHLSIKEIKRKNSIYQIAEVAKHFTGIDTLELEHPYQPADLTKAEVLINNISEVCVKLKRFISSSERPYPKVDADIMIFCKRQKIGGYRTERANF